MIKKRSNLLDMKKIVSQFKPDIKTTIQRFDRIKSKIWPQMMPIISNQIYIYISKVLTESSVERGKNNLIKKNLRGPFRPALFM